MTDTVTITKDATVEVRVYVILCSECGSTLDFNVSTDRDDDLIVKAWPCDRCMKNARDEGIESVEKEP